MDIFALAQQLFRHMTADKNTLYVLCPFNIGDFLINGGFCHALLKKKRKRACVLIERDRFANSGLNFVGVKEVRYIPKTLMDLLRQYVYSTREYENDNFVYGHFHMRQNFEDWNGGLVSNKNLSFADNYKENVFGLPLDTELLPPLITPPTDYQKQRLHETYVLDKERTVILAPYANSVANLEENFWDELIAELKQKNKDFVVYTNVSNPREKVIPDTAPMVTSFSELMYIADKVNCFIGLRSGIFDLLAFTNAKLLYINTSVSWAGNLDVNFNHTNSKAFYLSPANEQAALQAFMRQNNLTNVDNIIFHDRISGKDVALSFDSLIEKILSAVD